MSVKRQIFCGLLIFLIVSLLLFGCAGSLTSEKLTREINNRSNKINTYYAVLETEILTGEMKQSFFVEQWYLSPDKYRIEISVPGREKEGKQVFVADGKVLWLFHQEIGDFYKLYSPAGEDCGPPFLLCSYWDSIINASKINVLGEDELERGKYYLVELIPTKTTISHAREKIWLETKSLLPVRIEIYDQNDSLNQVIIFQRIELNPILEEQIFIPANFR